MGQSILRFENYGTLETKDVYTLLDNGTYSIEHIMPQHLTPAWIQELGPKAEEIHGIWLHRLGNLTLTAYNSNMSNATFQEKRDSDRGYKKSGLRMNQHIAKKEHWRIEEMQERSDEMIEIATNEIWTMPVTAFIPQEKEFDSCTLEDEDFELKGRDIFRYGYQNVDTPVSSWTDMFEHVVKFLYFENKSVLSSLVYSTGDIMKLNNYFSNDSGSLRDPLKIDENIYVEKNTSTETKISILRKLFILYHADPMDLVFYLRDFEKDKAADNNRFELRKKYWSYALPVIQEANQENGCFNKCNPNTSNCMNGYFGIGGFCIICAANRDEARVDFYLGISNAEENKKAFDYLKSHKEEIESVLGVALNWDRAEEYKASWISYSLKGISILNESDWTRMARFHAKWSKKYVDTILPILKDSYGKHSHTVIQKERIFSLSKQWARKVTMEGKIKADLEHSNRSYIRFTTKEMSSVLPDTDGLSGWGTHNHYFFEIVNITGNTAYIKMCLNAKNLPDDCC